MQQDRRSFLADSRSLVDADRRGHRRLAVRRRGRPGERAQLSYDRSLVGHDHRHRQVHRLRQLRARLQGREQRPDEPGYFRTWVERYQVAADDLEHPIVDSPNGGYDGFPELEPTAANVKSSSCPKLCNHCAHSPCVQVCPVGATFESPDGVVLVDKTYCLGCRYCVQACPYGCRYIDPRTHDRRQVHALLSPDHQGPHHGVLRGVPHRRASARRSEEPERSGA